MSRCSCESCPARFSVPSLRKRRLPLAVWIFLVVAAGTLILDAIDARAEVYHSRESALELAFPEADSVTTRTLTLGAAATEEIVTRAGAQIESRIVRIYEAWAGGAVTARGLIDTHNVRSLPETLFVVVDPDHRVLAVHLLAFHEPVQYRASDKWFAQFEDRGLDSDLAVRQGIAGVAGATMTSNAVTAAVRRSLAIFEVSFPLEAPVVGK